MLSRCAGIRLATLTPNRAEVLRDVLGSRKRVELGPDELDRRRVLGKRPALAAGRANAGARYLPNRIGSRMALGVRSPNVC